MTFSVSFEVSTIKLWPGITEYSRSRRAGPQCNMMTAGFCNIAVLPAQDLHLDFAGKISLFLSARRAGLELIDCSNNQMVVRAMTSQLLPTT